MMKHSRIKIVNMTTPRNEWYRPWRENRGEFPPSPLISMLLTKYAHRLTFGALLYNILYR